MIQVSEQGSRKNLYQRIVLQFPEGWMNSGQISREGVYIKSDVLSRTIIELFPVSAMKKKYEKETMEGED